MGNITVFQDPKTTSRWLDTLKPQMGMALPKHLSADRMARLVLTAFSTNRQLADCTPTSVAQAVMTASQLGLEPGVNGQAYLIPYRDNRRDITVCTFVPGWKGLVDLANRGGRCTVWTQAVYAGDEFDYALGDRPFVTHKPGDDRNETYANLQFVYAIGRIKGQEVPVIEVWSRARVERHLERMNKQGDRHYALDKNRANFEMYGRKVALLQVLKYMPQSIELTAAMAASNAADAGRTIDIDGVTWVTSEDGRPYDGGDTDDGAGAPPPPPAPTPGPRAGGAAAEPPPPADTPAPQGAYADSRNGKPPITDDELRAKKKTLGAAIAAGEPVNEVIAALELKYSLSAEQKMEVASWAPVTTPTGA